MAGLILGLNEKNNIPRQAPIDTFDIGNTKKIIILSVKGKVIKTPDFGVTRPPLSRLRKAIFDFLNPYLEQCSYLDLFSGTGSYLFEAASRGGVFAYGIEIAIKLVESINLQAEKFWIAEKLI